MLPYVGVDGSAVQVVAVFVVAAISFLLDALGAAGLIASATLNF